LKLGGFSHSLQIFVDEKDEEKEKDQEEEEEEEEEEEDKAEGVPDYRDH
jgi:hypothetical protein